MDTWARVNELFREALALAPPDRERFVLDASQGDERLRHEVLSLLEADDQAAGFLSNGLLVASSTMSSPALEKGRHIGHFVVTGTLGAGGMGEVYRAEDTRLGRDVALKVLPRAMAGNGDSMALLRHEARVLASLTHPCVAAIYGLEEYESGWVLVLELVEGETLASRLRRGALSLAEALRVARDIAHALEAAHGRGIVHRDLKPENVKLTLSGGVKLLDFGLAKFLDPESARAGLRPTLTARGAIFGTPAYMAPERVRGLATDARSDIWALGVVLWEMVTGEPLFTAATIADTLVSILSQEPDWSLLPAGTPSEVFALLRGCLARDPAERLSDMRILRASLEDAITANDRGPVAVHVARSVKFDRFQFDPEAGRLWTGDSEVHLTPKAAAVLARLIAEAGRPVTKAALFEDVWPGTAVGDDALTTCVAELRRVLGDDARRPRFIETRHRRGYRFVAALSAMHEAAPHLEAVRQADVTAIAVLPFADMSPARDQEYLCEGLAEELINVLTQVKSLRVAARTASFRFRAGADVRAVGAALGVGALLQGSVRKSGDRLRFTVQLVDVATGYQRWSQGFERDFADVFAIQDEIAASVVASLRGDVLSVREEDSIRRPAARAEAYEFFLRGRQALSYQTREGHRDAVRHFERGISMDPSYAPAHAGLAMAHAALHDWFGAAEEDRVAAERASAQALAIAPHLPDVHVARGCALALSRRYDEAAREFTAALELNANLFEAYYYYARTSFAAGEIARSAELFEKAAAVRREDFQSALLASQSHQALGRHDEARAIRREGIRRAERALELNPSDTRALSLLPVYLLDEGLREQALAASERGLALHPEDMSTLINGACLRSRLGLKDQALDLLEKALTRHWGNRDWIANDSDYDNLRDDPRFQRLMANLK